MASGKGQFRVGDVVSHKKLGKGEVLDVYPLGEETCAVISFENSGQKKVILKFANLELISRAKGEPEHRVEVAAPPVEEAEAVVSDEEEEVEAVAEEEEEAEEEKP